MKTCGLCGAKLVISEIDKAENIAWLSCPEFMDGNDAHDSYSVELTEEVEEQFLNG